MTRNTLYAFGAILFCLVGLAPEPSRLITFLLIVAAVIFAYRWLRKTKRTNRLKRASQAFRSSHIDRYWRRIELKKQLQTV